MTPSLGKVRYALAFLFVMLAANFLAAQALKPGSDGGPDKKPTGHNPEAQQEETIDQPEAGPIGDAVVTGNGINYHGGPVLKGNPVPIYVIWYGNWKGTGSNTAATVGLVENFINTVGNTPYEKINSTYGDTTGNVSGNLALHGAIFDTGSQGTKLTNSRLASIVTRSFSNGLPKDPNGVYLVLTSSNVSEQGFCSQFCGFHTHQTLAGTDIKWSFVGNPDRCPNGCEAQTTGPNSPATGIGGADGLINVITHESEEAITDPDLNAWFDSSGQEDADKCNFNFGGTSVCKAGSDCSAAGNAAGARFNQTFGHHSYLMQQEWENANGGKCVQHL
jgi:hypothetical protein